MRSQSRLWFPVLRHILVLVRMSGSNLCLPPNLFVMKWLAKSSRCSTRCQTELRLVCPTIASRGTVFILPLTVLVISVTVAVIATMVAPLFRS